jgi:hypothetical protein
VRVLDAVNVTMILSPVAVVTGFGANVADRPVVVASSESVTAAVKPPERVTSRLAMADFPGAIYTGIGGSVRKRLKSGPVTAGDVSQRRSSMAT